jgi:regulator of sirC expression with transglutaminase-like and TPR domain
VRFPLLFLCLLGLASAQAASPELKPTTAKSGGKSSARNPKPSTDNTARTTAQLVAQTRSAIVRIDGRGRDGLQEGVGTGFIIDSEGLIATSLHVIGEGRVIQVRLADGSTPEVIGIHAWDRPHDLVILRVKSSGLSALPLGDSDALPQGAPVIALGHPLGLDHSVVEGVLSARRDLDGHPMLQLAMPIEPGNSGGPLLDRVGRVHGIVNAKSLLTQNLGFATPANHLKALLKQPNPMVMARWLRQGALNTNQWDAFLGSHWRQKGNRILADGAGSGFGGRSYLLKRDLLPVGGELQVKVRLDNESGAAGLIFAGDESGRHYGFYPTGGELRLTAFEGPDVFSWRILGTVPATAYRSGDWNTLRVRRVDDGIWECSVNDEVVFRSKDTALQGSRVGLAKFRNTAAEFRDFRVGAAAAAAPELPPEVVASFTAGREPREALKSHRVAADRFLQERAQRLESEATRLRKLAKDLHREAAREALVAELSRPESEIGLARAALLLAWHDHPELDVSEAERQLADLGTEARSHVTQAGSTADRITALRQFLFEDQGFHGSRGDYRNPANSHLQSVLEDREGIPITLSIVFLEVAKSAGIDHMHGLPLPGHFLVRHAPPGESARLYDPFNGGIPITFTEADELGSQSAGVPVRSELLEAASPRSILIRMINNLRAFTMERSGVESALPYSDLLVAIAPDARNAAAERVDRARLKSQIGDREGAAADLRAVLETVPAGPQETRIREALKALESRP